MIGACWLLAGTEMAEREAGWWFVSLAE